MGKTDPDAPAPLAAVDDPGAGRHARRQGAAPPERVRLRRRAARPHGSDLRGRARAGRATSCSAKAAASRSRRGASGPGRIHHCMRLIGLAERALELMCKRAIARVAFGQPVAEQGVTRERIAEARCKIDMARLLTLKAAWMMDIVGNKVAKTEIAMIKVVAPNMACQVIDWAMQVHGGAGMCDDFPLAYAYAARAHAALRRRPGRSAPQRDRQDRTRQACLSRTCDRACARAHACSGAARPRAARPARLSRAQGPALRPPIIRSAKPGWATARPRGAPDRSRRRRRLPPRIQPPAERTAH